MNLQRWIALGIAALIVVCAATSNLWMAQLRDDPADGTPTPDADDTSAEVMIEGTAETTTTPTEEATATPTLNPIVEEMIASMGAENMAISNEPFVILAGDFTAIDSLHQGIGTASVYQIGDTQRILRLDPFTVTNGPDLHVLLSTHENPRTSTEALVGSIDLGTLQSTTAAQNFEIPPGTSLDQYRSVVIYGLAFNIVYSTAKLEPVRGQ